MFFKENISNIKQDFWLEDLKSSKPKTVLSALYSINHIENPVRTQIVNALENLLTHGNYSIRHATLAAVLEYDNGAIDELLPQIKLMLEDSVAMVREVAVIALGKCKSDTEDILKTLLKSKYSEVRYQAVISIAEKNYSNLASDILEILKSDPDMQVRTNAAIALGDMKITDAIDTLLNISQNDNNFEVRFEAAISAGYMGENSVVPILLGFIKKNKNLLIPVCELLGKLKHPDISVEMNKILLSVFRFSTREKLYAAAVLARHQDDSVKDFMISKLKSLSFETRITAMDRLSYTQQSWAIDALISNLNTKDELLKNSIFDSIVGFFYNTDNKKLEQNLFLESVMMLEDPLRTETFKKAIQVLKTSNNKQHTYLINLINKKLNFLQEKPLD